MMVKAKFKCDSVTISTSGEFVNLSPVTSGSEENKSFSKCTPSGSLSMMVTNEALFGHFIPGKEYYLDITIAE